MDASEENYVETDMGDMADMAGMPDMTNMAGMPDMADMAGMPDMADMPDMAGMPDMANTANMADMADMPEIPEATENTDNQKQGRDDDVAAGGGEKRWPGWPGESVFRILVPSQKVGGIIGRKGESIKRMCEESRARIKILDGPQGAPERAVLSADLGNDSNLHSEPK